MIHEALVDNRATINTTNITDGRVLDVKTEEETYVVHCYGYSSKDDSVEPPENLQNHFMNAKWNRKKRKSCPLNRGKPTIPTLKAHGQLK